MPQPNNPKNVKTGLQLAAVALFFFIALFVKRLWF